MMTCSYCEKEFGPNDIRPYGKDGALICFDCMKADSAREEEAVRQFEAILDGQRKRQQGTVH